MSTREHPVQATQAVTSVPCPFCGDACRTVIDQIEPGEFLVHCGNCNVGGPPVIGRPEDAVRAWSVRPSVPGNRRAAILPCPFCGDQESSVTDLSYPQEQIFRVFCSACEVAGPSGTSEQAAIDSWNHRAECSAAPAPLLN